MKVRTFISCSAALLLMGLPATHVFAQSKIKDGSVVGSSSLPNSNAVLEVESSSKGFLLPRVTLSSTALAAPLSAHVAGISVYNTATAGDVTPGYYYNDGAKWVRLADATAADLSKDAWVDDNANTMVKLGTQSDGSTARSSGTDLVIKDNGNMGVGTPNPSFTLDVRGGGIGQVKRYTNSVTSGASLLLTRSRGTISAENDIAAGDHLGKLQFRGHTGGTDADYSALAFVADSSTAAQGGHFAFLKSDLATEVMTVRTDNNRVGISTAAPSAYLDVNNPSAATSGLRVRNVSNSSAKQDAQINYMRATAPLFVDNNGYLYKKTNPVLDNINATAFDTTISINFDSSAAISFVSLGSGFGIVRFQLYEGSMVLGTSGIGANLYADITYSWSNGFRVATFGSNAGGSASNTVTVSGEGSQHLVFDFASGNDLHLINPGSKTGSLQIYYTGADVGPIGVNFFQTFRSR